MKGIVPRNIRLVVTPLLGTPFDLKFLIRPSSSNQTLMSLQSFNLCFFKKKSKGFPLPSGLIIKTPFAMLQVY